MGRVKCQFSEMIQHLEEGSSQILAFLDIQRFPSLFFFNMFSTCCLLKAGFWTVTTQSFNSLGVLEIPYYQNTTYGKIISYKDKYSLKPNYFPVKTDWDAKKKNKIYEWLIKHEQESIPAQTNLCVHLVDKMSFITDFKAPPAGHGNIWTSSISFEDFTAISWVFFISFQLIPMMEYDFPTSKLTECRSWGNL